MRKLLPVLLAAGFAIFAITSAHAQDKKKEKGKFAPPDKLFPPNADVMKQIETKTAQLAAKIEELRKNPKNEALLPDVEIYLRGARNIVRFNEWFNKASGQWTLDALDRGIERAELLSCGKPLWTTLEKPNVLRAYRSKIDGTAQPYGVTYPRGYGKDADRKWRVDVVLHGRNSTLTEVAFFNSHNGKKNPPADQDWVQIDIFGRGNNAYRWSGETDVMEVMRAIFNQEKHVDRRRVVLRGFSMGGAGTWHLGLRFPDKWCVMGPGAGFTTTHNYAWKGTKDLPDFQEKCLRIYDAVDYVENARMIPIVAFSGGDDPQKLAADNIEKRLKDLNIHAMTHLIKPGVGHKFEPDSFARCNKLWTQEVVKGHEPFPKKISFVTYTTKTNACDWVTISALEKHYEKATVEAEALDTRCRLTTHNVRELIVSPWKANIPTPGQAAVVVQIDGQEVQGRPEHMLMASLLLEKKEGKWRPMERADFLRERERGTAKVPGLQGPIDDAFASDFVCVTGTGTTWHPATQKFVDAKVKAFEYDWAKHWRGELPITNEYGVTPNEINEKHLILFGDPSSNFLLANIIDRLPIKWTKDEIEFAGKKYKSSEHVPVMIFPNPLNPRKYVVLNTGHTFPSEDYAKTNALLYPRLGDYAILRMTGKAANYEVATAGLFDEFWRVEKK